MWNEYQRKQGCQVVKEGDRAVHKIFGVGTVGNCKDVSYAVFYPDSADGEQRYANKEDLSLAGAN